MTPTSPVRESPRSGHSSAPVFCLTHHAAFVCCRSGACCTSGWPIHVETGRFAALRDAVGSGRLAFTFDDAAAASPFIEQPDLPPGAGAVLRTRSSGACVFYERDGGLCAIQRALGHGGLPSACQHFPRRCLIEPDRVAVSLSHYCPTVARLTVGTDLPPDVVDAPSSLVGHLALEGLDARDALPPVLRPGMLADREGYRAWERVVVEILAVPGTPERALDAIRAFTEPLRAWTPRDGELIRAVKRGRPRVGRLAAAVGGPEAGAAVGAAARASLFEGVRASVPAGVATAPMPDGLDDADARWVADAWPRFSAPLRRFLAAHAFGNWCAYHGMGLRTVVRSLEAALAVARVEAARLCAAAGSPLDQSLLVEVMRAADLLLVHLADPKMLASRLSAVEGDP